MVFGQGLNGLAGPASLTKSKHISPEKQKMVLTDCSSVQEPELAPEFRDLARYGTLANFAGRIAYSPGNHSRRKLGARDLDNYHQTRKSRDDIREAGADRDSEKRTRSVNSKVEESEPGLCVDP